MMQGAAGVFFILEQKGNPLAGGRPGSGTTLPGSPLLARARAGRGTHAGVTPSFCFRGMKGGGWRDQASGARDERAGVRRGGFRTRFNTGCLFGGRPAKTRSDLRPQAAGGSSGRAAGGPAMAGADRSGPWMTRPATLGGLAAPTRPNFLQTVGLAAFAGPGGQPGRFDTRDSRGEHISGGNERVGRTVDDFLLFVPRLMLGCSSSGHGPGFAAGPIGTTRRLRFEGGPGGRVTGRAARARNGAGPAGWDLGD